eukprot:TRINITY_DN48222_c0_g1_i1.p1 TRINITY_DN48222_c0_g1~~TRINITY_DN48222_c0_g1_i1.p1  ORF type:complete len:234 (-),score=39.34 TRINITY_DN48222_c0_g1_i1:138-839(-)
MAEDPAPLYLSSQGSGLLSGSGEDSSDGQDSGSEGEGCRCRPREALRHAIEVIVAEIHGLTYEANLLRQQALCSRPAACFFACCTGVSCTVGVLLLGISLYALLFPESVVAPLPLATSATTSLPTRVVASNTVVPSSPPSLLLARTLRRTAQATSSRSTTLQGKHPSMQSSTQLPTLPALQSIELSPAAEVAAKMALGNLRRLFAFSAGAVTSLSAGPRPPGIAASAAQRIHL